MITFRVTLNGRLTAIAGAEDMSVLDVMITATGRLGPAARASYAHGNGYDLSLRVGGLTNRGSLYRDEFLDWADHKLRPGDIVYVEIAEGTDSEQPIRRKPQVERRREFVKQPRKGSSLRLRPYARKRKTGMRTVYD